MRGKRFAPSNRGSQTSGELLAAFVETSHAERMRRERIDDGRLSGVVANA
jgi:hypothetical protein